MNTKDIYLVDLNPTKGAEINKARPCIIVSNDDVGVLPLKIVVPLIGYKEHHNKSWLVKIEPTKNTGLSKDSTADPMHIRSVSHDRILKKIGYIDDSTYLKLKDAIKVVLDLQYAWAEFFDWNIDPLFWKLLSENSVALHDPPVN